jgi:hypothetical protein
LVIDRSAEGLGMDLQPGRRQHVSRQLVVALCSAVVIALLAAVAAVPRAASASPTVRLASCAHAVSWQTARRMIGRVATIRGRVAGTKYAPSSNGAPTFLDVGVGYPDERRVTVVIWGNNRKRFGAPEVRYRHRTICVRGLVDTYAGVPEIEATSPAQIFVTR